MLGVETHLTPPGHGLSHRCVRHVDVLTTIVADIAGEALDLGPGDRADAGDAQVDPFDLLGRVAPEVVAVELLVLGVEAVGDLRGIRLVDDAIWSGDADLEGLPDVTHVDGPHEAVGVGGEALLVEGPAAAFGEVVEDRLHGTEIEPRLLGDVGLDVVVLDVDGEQPEGADIARVGRDHHAGEVEDVDETAGQQRPGAAEGRQHEVAHVEAPLDADLAQGVGLVPGADLENACGATLEVEPEVVGEGLDAAPRRLHIEGDLAAEQVRGDPA